MDIRLDRVHIDVAGESMPGAMLMPARELPGVLFVHGWGGSQIQDLLAYPNIHRIHDDAAPTPGLPHGQDIVDDIVFGGDIVKHRRNFVRTLFQGCSVHPAIVSDKYGKNFRGTPIQARFERRVPVPGSVPASVATVARGSNVVPS